MDALDDGFDGVDLIRPHHQELLLACDEDHVPVDRLGERALGEEDIGEVVQVDDFLVVLVGVLVDGQVALVLVEREMPGVVVGEVIRVVAVRNDEELDEAEERAGVAVAGVFFVFDDLLHRPARVDAQRLEFDLRDRHAGRVVETFPDPEPGYTGKGEASEVYGVEEPRELVDGDDEIVDGCRLTALPENIEGEGLNIEWQSLNIDV